MFATVLAGMLVIKVMSRLQSGMLTKQLQSRAHLGTRLIEVFDAIGLAAFTVVGVVVVLDTKAQPLWLWGPIAAVLTASFGGLMRDLFRHDRVLQTYAGSSIPRSPPRGGLRLRYSWNGRASGCSPMRSGWV